MAIGRATAPAAQGQPAQTQQGGGTQSWPFYGTRQAGVETPPTLLGSFIGINIPSKSGNDLQAVLRLLSDDSARLMAGQPALADPESILTAQPRGLTITFGLGAPVFSFSGVAASKPPQLRDIPQFGTDHIEPGWEQTDLLVSVNSNDPMQMAHIMRLIGSEIAGVAVIAWTQQGFRPAAGSAGQTPRNLMGQVDSTVNPQPGTSAFAQTVWMPAETSWPAGGTVLVLRRIRMLLDTWDQLDPDAKEIVIGRKLDTGAPLGATHERDQLPLAATDSLGLPVISPDAHVRRAHATSPQEVFLRRPFSYFETQQDQTDAGLLFAAYTADPGKSFIPVQQRLSESDALNRWTRTVGSSTYFIPPGVQPGGYIGQELFS